MKKKIKIALIFTALVILLPTTILAEWGGSGNQSGNSGGAGGAVSTCEDVYWQSGYDGIIQTAAYRFDLVYETKNGGREILKSRVVQVPSRAASEMLGEGNYSPTLIQGAKKYADVLNATGTSPNNSAEYVESGPLADLANQLLDGRTVDEIFPSGLNNANKDKITSYITSSEGFGMKMSDMRRDHDNNPGRYDSYGYRILIQKLQYFTNGCSGAGSWALATRKDVASNNAIKQYFFGNRNVWIAPNKSKAANDLFTSKDDIGITQAQRERKDFANAKSGSEVRNLAGSFRDENNGSGYNILWFSTDPFKDYDYSIDAACVNCSATGFENKAYVIQDTTNWEAILASPKAKVNNAKNYYNKGNNVFCREEYTVKFPDLTGHVKVNTGRYFTVNATNEELSTVSTLAPNFKPITVTRTRQCKSSTNDVNALNNFERNSRNTFKDNAGTVKLKYTEYNKNNSEYSKNSITLEPDEKAANTYSSNVSNNMLTMTQTVSYTLDDNVYRYIRLEDGLSIFDPSGINEDDLNLKYKDVGVANLPISFENETEGGAKIADVQLTYELPSDPNSKIKDAYKMNNNYFSDPSNPVSENIYKKAINAGAISNNSIVKGSLTDAEYEELTQSACAKLYRNSNGSYASGLYNCVNNRTSNKIG